MAKELTTLKHWQMQLFQELVELLDFHDSNHHVIGSLADCPDCQEFLLNSRATDIVTWLTQFYCQQNRSYRLFPLNYYVLQVDQHYYLLRARQLARAQQLLNLHLQKNMLFEHCFKITALEAFFFIGLEQTPDCRDEVITILEQHSNLSALILKSSNTHGWRLLRRLSTNQDIKKPLSI